MSGDHTTSPQSSRSARLARLAAVLVLPLALLTAPQPSYSDSNEAYDAAVVDSQRLLSLGNLHSCAVLGTGGVQCWGGNDNGQLGNGTHTTSTEPVVVSNLSEVVAISAGGQHTCALVFGGTAKCWGLDGSGQVGTGELPDGSFDSYDVPQAVIGLSGATAVAAGGFHTCAIDSDGTVSCWGQDGMGQLGDGDPGNVSPTPTPVVGITATNPAVALALGEFHSCAVLEDGTVSCWGNNGFGQLGDGTTTDRDEATAVGGLPDPDDDPALAITAGSSHTCVIVDDDDHSTYCWGHNAYGQLGTETPKDGDVMQPSDVPLKAQRDADPSPLNEAPVDLTGATAVTTGQYHTCVRRSGGSVWCWGNNQRVQLGSDPNPLTDEVEDSPYALEVASLGSVEAVSSGGFHSCALDGGDIECLGYNFFGQLGGYAASSQVPVLVTAVTGADDVTAGTGFACALVDADVADRPMCWGSNENGRLGADLGVADTTVRVAVADFDSADTIDAGNGHACALPAGQGNPKCWGRNNDGQLGNGVASGSSDEPVAVSGLANASTVDAGGALGASERGTTCARRTTGKVGCWGRNFNGQVGDGTTTDRAVPVLVQLDDDPDSSVENLVDLTEVTDVAVGGFHTCARRVGGTVACWGFNGNGQLGDNTTDQRDHAVIVQTDTDPDVNVPLTGVVALAAGRAHTCALINTGAVRCWGSNASGQLGDGTNTQRPRPVTQVQAVPGGNLTNANRITAGDDHSCASRADGSMVCWGSDAAGQLGNGGGGTSNTGEYVATLTPPPAEALPFITSISASRANTCATLIDTSVRCWGDNAHGQLGDGIGAQSMAPVTVGALPPVGTNHIPEPQDDTATTTPDTPILIDALANDTDADGDSLTLDSVADPSNGTAAIVGGQVQFTPDAGFCGDNTFGYSVSDGQAVASASITVEMNCAPVLVGDEATTDEDTPVEIDVLANDTDEDGDTLTITAVGTPAHGSAAENAGKITYTPDADFCSPPTDTFDYTVSDGHGHTESASLTVTVTCNNDGPVAQDDVAGTDEDTPVDIDVLANDTDVDGDALAIDSVTDPAHGTATIVSGKAHYVPDTNYCGPDTFDYVVTDGTLDDTGTVTVSVNCVADAPKALNDAATTDEDTAIVIDVLANDSDPDGGTLSITAVGDPAHGTAVVEGAKVKYTPDADYCGTDAFTYVVSNGSLTASASVEASVNCVNDAPIAADDATTTDEDTTVHVHVLTNDVDVDGDVLTASDPAGAAHGTTSVAGGGSIAYTPDADFCGTDSFTYTVTDTSGASDTGEVFVTITCVNDAPVLAGVDDQSTPWGETVAVLLSATDADSGDTLTFSMTDGPDGATMTPGGGFEWTPTASQIGSHQVKVEVSDGTATDQATFTITVGKRPTTLTYNGATEGEFSDAATLQAVLTDAITAVPIADRTVAFAVSGVGDVATTDPTGTATTAVHMPAVIGANPVEASFSGDARYQASSDEETFTVLAEAVTVEFTGDHLTQTEGQAAAVTLSATVTEQQDGAFGGALGGSTVEFRGASGELLCSGSLSASGAGAADATCEAAALSQGTRAVVVTVESAAYDGLADVGVFVVADPGKGDAAGAGAIGTTDDFGFRAVAQKRNAPPAGEAIHVITSGSTAMIVSSTDLGDLDTSCSGGQAKVCAAVIEAAGATTQSVDLETGQVGPATGSSALLIDATDAVNPATDTYAIEISGSAPYELGEPDAQVPISRGEVEIPS